MSGKQSDQITQKPATDAPWQRDAKRAGASPEPSVEDATPPGSGAIEAQVAKNASAVPERRGGAPEASPGAAADADRAAREEAAKSAPG